MGRVRFEQRASKQSQIRITRSPAEAVDVAVVTTCRGGAQPRLGQSLPRASFRMNLRTTSAGGCLITSCDQPGIAAADTIENDTDSRSR